MNNKQDNLIQESEEQLIQRAFVDLKELTIPSFTKFEGLIKNFSQQPIVTSSPYARYIKRSSSVKVVGIFTAISIFIGISGYVYKTNTYEPSFSIDKMAYDISNQDEEGYIESIEDGQYETIANLTDIEIDSITNTNNTNEI